jgi:hypothetical protein
MVTIQQFLMKLWTEIFAFIQFMETHVFIRVLYKFLIVVNFIYIIWRALLPVELDIVQNSKKNIVHS